MNQDISLRKSLLITVIGALCISALLGIIIFLLGSFGEVEFKILMTTLAVGGFSLTGLCCSVLLEKGRHQAFALTGIIISLVALLYSMMVIWGSFDIFGDFTWKLLVILLVVAFSSAHSALMLLINSDRAQVRVPMLSTVVFIGIVAAMIIILVLSEDSLGDFYYRLLGVFAILDALGSIVTPILNKVCRVEGANQQLV